MRHNYIRYIILCLCLLAGTNAFAQTKIDGIYYALGNGTAIVNPRSASDTNAYTGDVVIPEHVTYNGATYTVTRIGIGAFQNCDALTSVSIPTTVDYIGNKAFYGCTALTTVNIPEAVGRIFDYTFYGCSNLASIVIPDGVAGIGEYAFYGCSSMTCTVIGNGVTDIGEWAFYGCSSLTSLVIGNGLKYIGENTFQYCRALTAVVIPEGVTSIGDYAFCDCSDLASVSLPRSLTGIGKYAFCRCSSLASVTIPEGVKSIGECAFESCRSLPSVAIPDGISLIDYRVFAGCEGLTFVYVPNSVATIGSSAFQGCTNLATVVLGDGVTRVEGQAFYNCSGLADIYCYAPNVPPSVGSDAFNYTVKGSSGSVKVFSKATLHVPIELVGAYKEASTWAEFEAIVPARDRSALIDGIYYNFLFHDDSAEVTFGSHTYKGDVVIPGTVTHDDVNYKVTGLAARAFHDCSGLTSVTLPEGVTNIGKDTFANTSASLRVKDRCISLIKLWEAGYEDNIYDSTSGERIEPFRIFSDATASSLRMNKFMDVADAEKLSEKLSVDGKDVDGMTFLGLEPDTEFSARYSVSLLYDNKTVGYERTENVKTKSLTLISGQPRVISDGNVIVSAQSNLDDEETNVGFEWRRTDWTDDFDSRTGGAYLYEGMMEGYIRSINSNYLWRFRPYYTSNAGNTYYGEWKGMDPSDYSYFEPTVHTYTTINVTGNQAEVKGYAMRGTDNVTSQGFMYWIGASPASLRMKVGGVPSSAKTVLSSGNVMTATLEDLEYETTYCYVAFVTTSEGETFYGEVQTFSTSFDPDGIDGVKADAEATEVGRYDLSGRKLAGLQKGINIIRYSDGTARKVLVK